MRESLERLEFKGLVMEFVTLNSQQTQMSVPEWWESYDDLAKRAKKALYKAMKADEDDNLDEMFEEALAREDRHDAKEEQLAATSNALKKALLSDE